MRKIFFYITMFVMSLGYGVLYNNADWDLWARLTVGKTFFQTGQILKSDFLAYTIRKDMWIDHEWGSGVIFYFFEDHFGDLGLFALKITIIFTILILLSKIVKLQNTKINQHLNPLFYYLAFLAMFNGIGGTVRCQLFTFLFVTLWIYVLERVRRGENRLLWIFPVTCLFWANIHGGFVAGLGIVGIYAVGEFLNKKPFKKYLLILIPTVLITLINPYGIDYWAYILEATTMVRPGVAEWRGSFDAGLLKWMAYKVFLLVAFITTIYSVIQKNASYKKLDKVKYIMLLLGFYLSIKHIKHQAFLGLIGCTYLYHDFYQLIDNVVLFFKSKFLTNNEKFWQYLAFSKNALVYLFIIFAGVVLIAKNNYTIVLRPDKYPMRSIEFVRVNEFKGNLVTMFHWGSYAAWKLYPNIYIGMDGRYEELFTNEDYLAVHNLTFQDDKNWYDFINKYHTDYIIIDTGSHSYLGMQMNKEWKEVFRDNISAVFVRNAKQKKNYKIPSSDARYYNSTKFDSAIDFSDKYRG